MCACVQVRVGVGVGMGMGMGMGMGGCVMGIGVGTPTAGTDGAGQAVTRVGGAEQGDALAHTLDLTAAVFASPLFSSSATSASAPTGAPASRSHSQHTQVAAAMAAVAAGGTATSHQSPILEPASPSCTLGRLLDEPSVQLRYSIAGASSFTGAYEPCVSFPFSPASTISA